MPYKHTQTGYLTIITLVIFLLFFLTSFILLHRIDLIAAIILFILALSLALFYSLTVEIDEEKLSIKFGIGLIKKKFYLKNIESCQAVKNHWFYGWGIRWIPHGWLYNVSGLGAVELKMKNGKRYRVGTDEPQILEQAIRDNLKID